MNFLRRKTAAAPRDAEESPGWGMGLMRAASDILQRAGLASRAGLTFHGHRDLYEALGYKRVLGCRNDFRPRYERNGIAARVVDAFPQATWRGGTTVIEDDDPAISTPFEEAFDQLARRLDLFPTFQRVDVLAGLGRYSVMLIGAPGFMDEPLPDKVTAEQIMYVQPYAEDDAVPLRYVSDRNDVRFGLPDVYNLKRSHTAFAGSNVTSVVHWTRVVHVVDNLLDDRVFGKPRMERVWNWLDDLEKITGAGSEAFWLRAHQGFHYDLDKDLIMTPAEIDATKAAAEEMANGLRRTIATRGMKVNALGSDVANFANQVDSILTLIAGSTGIPKRILMGSERGELASTQDKTNWDERVADRRMEFAEPRILRPLVDLFIKIGALPEPVNPYEVLWPDVAALDMSAAADVATKWAGLNALASGVVVTPEEIRDRVLGMVPLSDAEVQAVEQTLIKVVPPPVPLLPGQVPPPVEGQFKKQTPAAAMRAAMKRRRLVQLGKALPQVGRVSRQRAKPTFTGSLTLIGRGSRA